MKTVRLGLAILPAAILFMGGCASSQAVPADVMSRVIQGASTMPDVDLDKINFDINYAYPYKQRDNKDYSTWNANPVNGGDCADFVAAKMKTLKDAGYDESRLTPLVGRLRTGEGHAALLVDGERVMDIKHDKVYPFRSRDWMAVVDARTMKPIKWKSQ